MKLNLGCSDDFKSGYLNVDFYPDPKYTYGVTSAPVQYLQADLNQPWPWEDSSVDEIYAHDVFEHLRCGFAECAPKTWVMNEAHRVLKPGGLLDMTVPCVMLSDGRVNPGAFADPTHVSYWTWDDAFYFGEQFNTPEFERGRLGPAYGITALFRFPPFYHGSGGWNCPRSVPRPVKVRAQAAVLRWELVDSGGGQERRSKIMAMLEAVK